MSAFLTNEGRPHRACLGEAGPCWSKAHLAQHTSKKKPITVEILQSHVSTFGNEEASLADIRTLSTCLLSFAGFLWYDKIANLKEQGRRKRGGRGGSGRPTFLSELAVNECGSA